MSRTLKAATAHIAPAILSASNTTQKVIQNVRQASKHGAHLVCFPEAFIPAFPVWSSFLPPAKTHDYFRHMVQESVYADGEEIKAIRSIAARSKIMVSLGISEKVRYSSATLFNSNLIIGEDGEVLVHHRKLMPTWFEKLTWSPGDGYGLKVAETKHGKVGALICGENTNALARYALMAQGEEVHISSWPAIWPSRIDAFEQIPSKENAPNYDNVAANRIRAAAHCFESKCFGIMCAPYLSKENIESLAAMSPDPIFASRVLSGAPRGASMFLDSTGAILPGFVVRADGTTERRDMLQDEEDILYTDMDMDACIEGKQYHDLVGGYQRLDVFSVQVNRHRQRPISFDDQPAS